MTDDRTPAPDPAEPDDRRAELIAAALAGELSPAEGAELDARRAADPTIDEEIALLGGLPSAIRGVGAWEEAAPSAELARRIGLIADGRGESAEPGRADAAGAEGDSPADSGRAEAAASEAVSLADPGRPTHAASAAHAETAAHAAPAAPADLDAHRARRGSRARRTVLLLAGAAACLALGAAGGAFLAAPRADVATGPAGTLGALEDVTFAGAPAGVVVEGEVVAHTWGTETVLSVDGLPAGDAFSIVVVDAAGGEHPSGTMLGSAVRIDCRLNADVLREDAASVEIRDAAGDRVAVADLPPVRA